MTTPAAPMMAQPKRIESQRDDLLDQIEERLEQGVSEEELFTVGFSAQQE